MFSSTSIGVYANVFSSLLPSIPSPPVLDAVDSTMINSHVPRTSHAELRQEPSKCPGYHLSVPHEQSPYSLYPFLVHSVLSVPWDLAILGEKIVLRSHKCARSARIAKTNGPGSSANVLPCSYCAQLHNHNIIMGIRHRSLDGAHESTPWAYLSPAQMYSKLERKTAHTADSGFFRLQINLEYNGNVIELFFS